MNLLPNSKRKALCEAEIPLALGEVTTAKICPSCPKIHLATTRGLLIDLDPKTGEWEVVSSMFVEVEHVY